MAGRVLALVLCGALAVALASCGDDEPGAGGTAQAAKKVRVYMLLPSLEDEAYIRQKAGAEQEAAADPSVELTVDAGSSRAEATALVAKVEAALTKGTDVIAVNPGAVGDALRPVLQRAVEQGVEVVTFDQDVPKLEGRATYVGWDVDKGAAVAAEYVRERLPDGGKLGVIRCFVGNPLSDAIANGFKAGIRGSGIDVVATLDAKCDAEKARTSAENMLTANPDLAAIFADVYPNALGAIKALTGPRKDVLLVTEGANVETLKLVASGALAATTDFPSEMFGAEAVRQARALGTGAEATGVTVRLPAALITKDNVQTYLDQAQVSSK